MKLFTAEQVRNIDKATIEREPVTSSMLMERASIAFADAVVKIIDQSRPTIVYAGMGNNGGDGLAVARILAHRGFNPEVCIIKSSSEGTADFNRNLNRLTSETTVKPIIADKATLIKKPDQSYTVIDALLGTGIAGPARGLISEAIVIINEAKAKVISIDIPSGLLCDSSHSGSGVPVINAKRTFTFQFPKIAFMFAENEQYTGIWEVLDIGLNKEAIEEITSPYNYNLLPDIFPLIKSRDNFSHKGNFGHALLAAGSEGKTGALTLSARACMKAGVGLLTCHIPGAAAGFLNNNIPEAMYIRDSSESYLSDIVPTDKFNALAAGPGLGTAPATMEVVRSLLANKKVPLLLDADALNILSLNQCWLEMLNSNTVITPHPGEFDRLAGKSDSGYERFLKQINFSRRYGCVVVLKGAHTSVTDSKGNVWFNSTGNPGMATAGSGDVLTGLILSLLAQGYGIAEAAICGVFIHGEAGDLAEKKGSYESVTASDIINETGNAFRIIREASMSYINSNFKN